MSDDERPKRSFITSGFFTCEVTPPSQWNLDDEIVDPFFGDEENVGPIFTRICYETEYQRSIPLGFDPDGTRSIMRRKMSHFDRSGSSRQSYVSIRARRFKERQKTRERQRREREDRERRSQEFRDAAERERRAAYSQRVTFLLNQCVFVRKHIKLLLSFGDCVATSKKQLKDYQEELLRIRAEEKAA